MILGPKQAWLSVALFVMGALMMALHMTLSVASAQNERAPGQATIITIDGPIGPATASYLRDALAESNMAGDALFVIEMDTPGGLDNAMRDMVQAISGSDVPVVTYVTPTGARAASAGLYILYASHFAAMAPGTNTGSATPVQLGGPTPVPTTPQPRPAPNPPDETADGAEEAEAAAPAGEAVLGNDDALRAKVVNDAAAYIEALANFRGRNGEWAVRAVRDAASVSASEALSINVIDVVAADLDDLFEQLDGRVVPGANGTTLSTQGLVRTRVEPDLTTQILSFLSNPNVALIFMSLGVYGIIIEMWNPGSIFPGALGVVSLIIGFYSLQIMPVNWMGAALMGVGALLIALEAFAFTFGILGLTGLIIFVLGAYLLFPEDTPGFEVSPILIGSLGLFGGVFLGAILFAITRSRVHGPVIGEEAIRRRQGLVDSWNPDSGEGHVIVEGERWRARADQALEKGRRVRVKAVEGLVLKVEPIKG